MEKQLCKLKITLMVKYHLPLSNSYFVLFYWIYFYLVWIIVYYLQYLLRIVEKNLRKLNCSYGNYHKSDLDYAVFFPQFLIF